MLFNTKWRLLRLNRRNGFTQKRAPLNSCSGSVRGLLLASIVFTSSLSIAQNAALPLDISQLDPVVTASLTRIATRHQLLVGPGLKNDIRSQLNRFTSNFCYPYDQQIAVDRCTATVGSPSALDQAITNFLIELRDQRATRVESVGNRLAREIGYSLEAAGYPTHLPIKSGVVKIPALNSKSVRMLTSEGAYTLGEKGDWFFALSGRHQLELTLSGGKKMYGNVDVQSNQRSPLTLSEQRLAPVIGRITPQLSKLCYQRMGRHKTGPLVEFNFGRGSFSENEHIRLQNQADITQAMVADIDIQDFTEQCDQKCEQQLAVSFAQAIAVWRSGCARCDPNAFSVIRVGDQTWLNSRLVQRLRDGANQLDLAYELSGERQTLTPAPSSGIPQTWVHEYTGIDSSTDLPQICALSPNQAPWVNATHQLLCGRPSTSDKIVRPLLKLLPGDTSCGLARDFVACGKPGEQIEVTLWDTLLSLRQGEGGIGDPNGLPVEAFDIVLHEVGHWFGVPHASIVPAPRVDDIMTETYGVGQACVSGQSLTLLNNAADTRWTYRVTENIGLRRPQHAKENRRIEPVRGRGLRRER